LGHFCCSENGGVDLELRAQVFDKVARMPMLNPPRCPNCHSQIELKELWRLAPKKGRRSAFAGKIGFVCPMRGIKLLVLDRCLQITSVGLFLLMLCGAAVVGKLSRSYGNERGILVGLFTVYAGGFLIFQRSIPRLLQLRPFEAGEKAGFPLVTLAEDLAARREAMNEGLTKGEAATESGPVWVCPKCHEENPGNFDECWKCQTWRVTETKHAGDPPDKEE
jgi:hypothetical protein